MKFTLRTKILVSVECILCVFLGTSTVFYIHGYKQNYLESLDHQFQLMVEQILTEVKTAQKYNPAYQTNPQRLLKRISLNVRRVYEVYRQYDVHHMAVIDDENVVISDTTQTGLIETPVESPLLRDHLRHHRREMFFDETLYHALFPIWGIDETYIGAIDVGFSREILDRKIHEILAYSLGLLGINVVLSFVLIWTILHLLMTKPIRLLVRDGQQIAEGQPLQQIRSRRQDEIGMLKLAFYRIGSYFQSIAKVASRVADGQVDEDVPLRSDRDVLGKAVQQMVSYLKYLAGVATNIAEGNLPRTIQVRSDTDTFGRSFRKMTEGLRTLILQIRTSAEQIASTGETISSLSAQDIDIVNNVHQSSSLVLSSMEKMHESVGDVARNMDSLSDAVEASASTVTQMAYSISSIDSETTAFNEQTGKTLAALHTTMTSLERVVGYTDLSENLAQETIRNAREGQTAIEHVMNSMQTIQHTVETAIEAISRFEKRSQDIGTILDVIREVTDQTSLLALNASIIAAQAGEHGLGFAVVANEIKALANDVGNSTQDIAAIITALQQDVGSVVKISSDGKHETEQGFIRTQQACDTLQNIIAGANKSSDLVMEITTALQALKTTGHDVMDAMDHIRLMTGNITRTTDEQKKSTRQITQMTESLYEMASQTRQMTVEQTACVRRVLEAMASMTTLIDQNLHSSQQILSITEELSAQSDVLLHSVANFKLN